MQLNDLFFGEMEECCHAGKVRAVLAAVDDRHRETSRRPKAGGAVERAHRGSGQCEDSFRICPGSVEFDQNRVVGRNYAPDLTDGRLVEPVRDVMYEAPVQVGVRRPPDHSDGGVTALCQIGRNDHHRIWADSWSRISASGLIWTPATNRAALMRWANSTAAWLSPCSRIVSASTGMSSPLTERRTPSVTMRTVRSAISPGSCRTAPGIVLGTNVPSGW